MNETAVGPSQSNADECCESQLCKHKSELVRLRRNVLALLHNLMPQYVLMSGMDNADVSADNNANRQLIQIDTMVDCLVQQMNS